jgi:uncharacterized small protein (DUF1192 family)
MAGFDEDSPFGAPRKAPTVHEIGQSIDVLSAPELAERIESLRREITRLEDAIKARESTKQAARAFFKT